MGGMPVAWPDAGSNATGVDVGVAVGGEGAEPASESSLGGGGTRVAVGGRGSGVAVANGGTGGRVDVGSAWGAGAASTENRPTPRLPHSINRPKNPSNNTLAPALIAHSLPGCGAAAGSA
jgi:hypothetical protein